ncbi:MAG: ATPase [Comamonadaceae bacterium CG17_big_fil_post_rev_8_21_14_2_50_60_13]|nr:MAG: ATPase [Comamonadaceae bacterium CG17_big_fil_post_rev_8_21_14_2_50_60_13]
MSLHPILLEKLNAALLPLAPVSLTLRDTQLPKLAGKVHAVIGMRRAGKTTFLQQLLAQQRQLLPPERSLYLSFDDDRLAGLDAQQLSLLLEEYYRRYPELRGRETVHWFLDEIQLIPGWERFVRRVLDSEKVQIVVSGSSARMLSREVHTSLRGRGIETIIRPFSFREFLRHRGEEPQQESARWTSSTRSGIEKRFGEYLREGGFAEVQGLAPTLRIELLQGYVDTVLFRDVVERYGVSQVAALRWLIRQCLRNPAGALSVHRLHLDLKAQGLGVAKDAVHAMFGYLQDAFLIDAVALATESERQRNTNARKVYPIDTGLIGAFDTRGRANVGHALECVVQNELARRKHAIGYGRTAHGLEIDFQARNAEGALQLIQVCADVSEPATLSRELRALDDAAQTYPDASRHLLVLERPPQPLVQAQGVQVQPVYEWLLATDAAV